MAKFNVGEAFLQVTASADGIHRQIAAEVAKIPDIDLNVGADMTRFREELATEVSKLAAVNIDVEPNLTGFREKVAAATSTIRNARVDVDTVVNTAKADAQVGAFATKMRTQLDAAIKSISDFRFGADTSEVDRKIASIRAQLVTLREQSIRPDFDDAEAVAKIHALESQLILLASESPTVKAKFDAASAAAQLAAFEASVNRLDGRNVNVGVKVDGQGASLMLTAISAGALAIAPALAPAIALLGTMPAVITAAAAPIGALVAGFSGVGTAVKAMSAAQAAATGTAAEQAAANEKLAQAMANLSPAAQSFVQTLQGQMVPALQALKFEVQQGLFPGLEQALKNIQPLIPVIAQGLANTGQVLGQLASQAAALMASGPFRADFAQIMASNNRALASWGQAGLSLLDVFRNLASAAGPLVERFATWAQSASATFAAFIEGKRATGELGLAFQQAGDFISQLSTVLSQVVGGITNFASAIAPLGAGFLSVVGSIVQFIGQLSQMSPLLAQVATVALGLVPILSRLPQILEGIGTAATGLSAAFTFLTTAGGLAVTLQGVALAAGEMTTRFTGSVAAGDAVANMGGRLSTVLTTVGAALPVLGAAVVAASFEWQAHKTAVDEAAQALLQGGQAAQQVTTQLQQMDQASQSGLQAWNWIGKVREWIGLAAPAGQALQEVKNRADELKNAMDPLAQAQQEATQAQNNYLTAVQQFGPASSQAALAQQQFQLATQQVTKQQDLLKTALQGTTQALQAQAAALGSTLSAHVDFLNKVQGVNDALTKNKATLDLSTQAGRDNTTAVNAMIQAALTWEQDAKKSGASTTELAGLHQALSTAIQDNAGKFGLLPPEVQKVVDAFVAAKPNVDLKPTVDASGVKTGVQDANTAIDGIRRPPPITFSADVAQALSQVGLLSPKIDEVPKAPPPTVMTADVLQALAQVGLVSPAIETVTGVEHKALITADASGVTTGVGQANASLGTLQPKTVAITATDDASATATTVNAALTGIVDKTATISVNDQASGPVNTITGLINGVPNHTSTININDQASGAISNIANQINGLQNRTITITTVYQTVGAPPGQAAGGIIQQMAGGGSLSPMSGSTARIVPPNTWRVIGDRMHGDEAFIPINNSPRSMAILGATANRMGFALAPMSSGGFTSRDRQAWGWLEELLRRYRHGHGGGGGTGGGGVPVPTMPVTQGTSSWENLTSSTAFGGGNTASYVRSVKAPLTDVIGSIPIPQPTTTSPPAGSGGGPTHRTVHVDSNSALIQEVMRLIRTEVRKQGGDVQLVLGR